MALDRIFYNYISEDLNAAYSIGSMIGTMHFHLHYEINCVVSGKISIINNGTTLDCDYPCVLFHAPCSFHKVISSGSEPYERYKFHFNESFLAKFNPEAMKCRELFSDNLTIIPLVDAKGEEILSVLRLFPRTHATSAQYERFFAFLLDLLAEQAPKKIPIKTNRSDPGKIGYIGNVLSYISENYSSELTVDDISRRFYVSKTKLNDDFKEIIGKTIKQHIIDVRISNAMRMLTGGLTVMDTAHECGFVDESHFIRTFRERVGSSPKKFAKNAE